jgi:type IV secretory pathway VirB2 component (pilin)
MNTQYLAQIKIPGNDTDQVEVVAPSGLTPAFRTGGEAAGRAFTQTAFDWIFYIAIILAVLFIMWSGIQWMTSGGDVGRIQSAKRRLLYAIIGLVIVLMSFVIVRVVITTIGGNSEQFFSPFGGLEQPSP